MANAARPLAVCAQCLRDRTRSVQLPGSKFRSFSLLSVLREELRQQTPDAEASHSPLPVPPIQPNPPSRPLLDPTRVVSVNEEKRLLKHQKLVPIGSRRRRAALKSTSEIPFEQLPYQCFQEARKVLAADRLEKVKQIETQRARILRLLEQDEATSSGKRNKQRRLDSMRAELERLKIMADINDPMVKKRFEDGHGDMNKPIYRFLADRKWREYKRPILVQRITQMKVVPDIIPSIDPVLDIDIKFAGHLVPPGNFVLSTDSEYPPTLGIQKFDKGEELVTIAAVDADVPDLGKDGFTYRCHGIWSNIRLSPISGTVQLHKIPNNQVVVPWMPPFAQQGSPYHRIALFVLQQHHDHAMVPQTIAKGIKRDGFILRSFIDKHKLKPTGATMFRCQWDEGTAAVMERAEIPGADIMLKRKKAEKLPEVYRRKNGARYRGFK